MNKRKISLIMSFILIFSLIMPVFAETILVDTGNKSENINNEINIDENNNKDLLINDNSSLNSEITIDNSNNLEEMQSGQGNKGEEPAQDFNEEIVEFKQYVRDITNDSNSRFSEYIEHEQVNEINGKDNTVEHMFTLKTRPLSRDYTSGELKIMPLGFKRNNKMFKEIGIKDNAIFNTIRSQRAGRLPIYLIDSNFFSTSIDLENSYNLFARNSYLTNKNPLKKGQALDISYKYQEYLYDFLITNNSEVQEKTIINSKEYLGSKMMYKSPHTKNIEAKNFYALHEEDENYYIDYINYLYEKISNDKYEYASISLSDLKKFYQKFYKEFLINNKDTIYNYMDPITFSMLRTPPSTQELFYTPIFLYSGNNIREPLLYTDLNGKFPKLTFTADYPLVYVDKNGNREDFNPGDEITLIENGKPKRFFGNTFESKNEFLKYSNQLNGSFFAKRDLNDNKKISLSFNLYDTRYKDENRLFSVKDFCKIDCSIMKYPNSERPQLLKIENTGESSLNFLLEDLFLNNNEFFYNISIFRPRISYRNKSFKNPLKNIPFNIQGMILYNKDDPTDNTYFNIDKQFFEIKANQINNYVPNSISNDLSRINNDISIDVSNGLKSFKEKVKNNQNKKYKIKFIFKMTDNAGENNVPFFENIKSMDTSNNLKAFNNTELNNLIKNINLSNNNILYDFDKDIIDYPSVHLFQDLEKIDFANGKSIENYVKFNVLNAKISNVAIMPNDFFLNQVDDDTIFEYNFAFPKGFTCNGEIKTSLNSSLDSQIANIDDYSVIKIKFTKKDLLKHIKEQKSKFPKINYINKNNPYSFDVRYSGDILVKKDKFKNMSSSSTFLQNKTFKDSFKIYSKTEIPFTFINNKISSTDVANAIARNDLQKMLYSTPKKEIIDKNTIEFSYSPIKFFEEFYYNLNNYCTMTPSPEFVAGIINTIKGPTDTDFTLSPQRIDYSALYQNKISVQTASTPMTDTTIFYDIENAKPKFVNWKGILKGIDVSNIEKQGYKVEIHSNEKNYSKDLSEQGWHLFESTQDLSKIKSLAFKILDKNNKAAVLPEEKLFSIILNMQVPEESKVSKVDGKPTHSYSNVYAQWRGTNESEVHGIHSETIKLSLKDSIIDDIEAKGNHQIIVEKKYIGNFSESKKNLNRIIILKGRNNGKEYRIYKDKIGFVEPDIYDIEYIISKDVEILEDSTKEIEVKETFEDSLDKIKVKYQIKENVNNGYTDSDQKENLYAIKLK